MYFIEAQNISKSYGPTQALDNFSLTVEKGAAFALLGPNGAGKTTFVKALLNLVHLNQGEIKLMGKDHKDPSARQKIAYLPERFHFYKFEKVGHVLEFFGNARGMGADEKELAIKNALERAHIPELRNRKLGTLSKGQTQRVGIASLLMGPIEAMILDEPFSGIDPIGSKELKELLLSLRSEGMTLFVNSHILSEMEKVCQHIAVLDHGRCLATGAIADLVKGQSLEDYFYGLVKAGVA